MIEEPTLWRLVAHRAARTPDALMAVDDAGRTISFAAYAARAERVAAGLAGLGAGPGRAVAWQLPTGIEALVVTAALARLGATQCPLLPVYRHREVSFAVAQARPCLLVVPGRRRGFDHEALAAEVAGAAPGLLVVVADDGLPEGDPSCLPPPPDGGTDARWLYYTSGTTGEPKGVRHSDRSVLAAARAMALGTSLTDADRVPLVFPVSHVGGAVWLGATLMAGSCALVVEAFDPVTSIDFLDAEGATLGAGGTVFVGTYLARQRALGDRPILGSVRAFLGGASPKPAGLADEVGEAFRGAPLLSAYGLTECPIATCSRLGDPAAALASTEGRPSPGVEITVVRPDGSAAAAGEEGELLVRGPQLFCGYADPALDAGAFDAAGRFRTGDLGSLDAGGFLRVTGRVKEVIVRKGESISAREIEDLLAGHPGVAEVAVVGLPDPVLGERCCAVVAPADPADPLTFEGMVGYLRGFRLMAQKIPEQLEIVDALPRNATGKVVKHELEARYARS